MEGMSINNLPIELLEHIISFLSPSERLKSTLISRRFAQAFNQSPMNDIWLVVRADLIDEAEAIISNSTRQYKNIRICKADPLEFNSIIWTKLGISLRQLEFVACRYASSGVLYNFLHACPSLESLVIRELWVEEVLNVSDESEMNVSMMSRFFEEPENVPLSHEAIMPIFELTKLRELRLDLYLQHDDRPVEDFVRGLGQLSSLECLHLSHGIGQIGHTCLQNLATLPNLQDLLLDHLEWDANCLRTITFDFKNLRRLSINSIIGGRLVDFQESERKVLDVAINSGSDPRGERIKSSRLETLEMCGVPLTDVGLACIATHHSKLKILRLAMCDKITDAGVVNLHKQQPLLEELWICDCPSINSSFLRALEELCPRLRRLNVWDCAKINRSAAKSFRSRRPEVLLVLNNVAKQRS